MDNITHSLIGAIIGQAGLKKKTGLAMPALIIGANLPDSDVGCLVWITRYENLVSHRGISHGPLGMVLLPLILAIVLWGFDKWQTRRGTRPEGRVPVRFGWLYILGVIACLTHPTMDFMNTYGIRFLEPFSHRWFYGDTLFIIDLVLWLSLGFGVWCSRRREKAGGNWTGPARAVIVFAIAYIGVNAIISQRARAQSLHTPVIASQVPVFFWKRELIEKLGEGRYLIKGKALGDCDLKTAISDAKMTSDLRSYLFFNRAPLAMRAPDGSTILRDARYMDPRMTGSFIFPLPNVKCVPIVRRHD